MNVDFEKMTIPQLKIWLKKFDGSNYGSLWRWTKNELVNYAQDVWRLKNES